VEGPEAAVLSQGMKGEWVAAFDDLARIEFDDDAVVRTLAGSSAPPSRPPYKEVGFLGLRPNRGVLIHFSTLPPRPFARCRQIPRAASQGTLFRAAALKVALDSRRTSGSETLDLAQPRSSPRRLTAISARGSVLQAAVTLAGDSRSRAFPASLMGGLASLTGDVRHISRGP
jgi:hypothetical protein